MSGLGFVIAKEVCISFGLLVCLLSIGLVFQPFYNSINSFCWKNIYSVNASRFNSVSKFLVHWKDKLHLEIDL